MWTRPSSRPRHAYRALRLSEAPGLPPCLARAAARWRLITLKREQGSADPFPCAPASAPASSPCIDPPESRLSASDSEATICERTPPTKQAVRPSPPGAAAALDAAFTAAEHAATAKRAAYAALAADTAAAAAVGAPICTTPNNAAIAPAALADDAAALDAAHAAIVAEVPPARVGCKRKAKAVCTSPPGVAAALNAASTTATMYVALQRCDRV